MNTNYPLKFQPIYKEKLWGGQKIKSMLGKDFGKLPNCGESWELSGVAGDVSVVANGPLAGTDLNQLLAHAGADLMGQRVYEASPTEFPLLIKFLDANEDLSIQVHPNDEQAKAMHGCLGKTEMWYILQADADAKLIAGFNKNTSREEYQERLANKRLKEILNEEQVASGDVFFIPAGRVHTIGKGILLAEIQQTSDVTYRIYDFDRIDANGQKRALHTAQALEVIDFKKHEHYKSTYDDQVDRVNQLVSDAYFETNKITLKKPMRRDLRQLDSFVIYICIEGFGSINAGGTSVPLQQGETVLVPACIADIQLQPDAHFGVLETYVPLTHE
ncbi:MAG: mannose-6-phosphate isomerase [Sphingobacteriaceae bacterium]|nr:mannose-6-phosphate isomerase [Sphingobacteriaceae bacterium]